MKKNKISGIIAIVFVIAVSAVFGPEALDAFDFGDPVELGSGETVSFDVSEGLPRYEGEPYVEVNDGIPFFDEEDLELGSFEKYSRLDSLGRCGTAFANISPELMPTDERQPIGSVKPTGWHTASYPEVIPERYLYNRCHLIAWCLAGENANRRNLITGTRYMNVEGMLPAEEKVLDYVRDTGNHVLYRVTPVFEGDNLVASGVLMEAYSVEDSGEGICICVYCFNVQPGVWIDYETGESGLE